MKYATLFAAFALMLTGTLAAPNPEAKADADPQICYCANPNSCYDTCSQKFCC